MDWQKLFQSVMQTEEQVLPMFIHNPKSQQITGAILVTESIFANFVGSLATTTIQPLPPQASK